MSLSEPRDVLRALHVDSDLVSLRPVVAGDAPAGFELLRASDGVLDSMIWTGPRDLEALRSEFSTWREQGAGGSNHQLAVIERASSSFCGAVTLRLAGHAGVCELGFWLGRPFWGRGLGGDLARVATWLALEHLGAQRVQAVVFVGNEASRRALARCGFALDREFDLPLEGRPQRVWHLSVERDEFDAAQAGWRPASCEVQRSAASEASSTAVEGRSGPVSPGTDRRGG